MGIKQIILVVIYGVACFIGSLAFVQCSEKHAQESIKQAEFEANEAKAALDTATRENAVLRANLAKYDEVLGLAFSAIEKAYSDNVQRIEKIYSAPSDWLQCELPDGVREVFGAYCDGNGNGISSGDTPSTM